LPTWLYPLLPATTRPIAKSASSFIESNHQINFRNGSTPIARYDEILAKIGALGSPLGPHSEIGLATYLYSVSTLIAHYDESNHRINFKQPQ
jgi:hypothetical protein